MGRFNFLVEGVSGSGKSSVCAELRRRGFEAIDGDNDLAYQGDPITGVPTPGTRSHWHHLWDVESVRARAAKHSERLTFFCGGSRNHPGFIDVFDIVFVLDVDLDTLRERLDRRSGDEFGASLVERDLVESIHRQGRGIPAGVPIDATKPLAVVVDEITRQAMSAAARRGRFVD